MAEKMVDLKANLSVVSKVAITVVDSIDWTAAKVAKLAVVTAAHLVDLSIDKTAV